MSGRIQNEDIKSVAELTGGGGAASQLPNDDKIWVTANAINKTLKQAFIDEDIGAPPTCGKETLSVDSTDYSNGYLDLAAEALVNSLHVIVDRSVLIEGVDYTTSIVSLVTRVTWAGEYGAGGSAEIQEGSSIHFKYIVA